MTYVDGFICPVPTANKEAYKKHAEDAFEIFKEFGALTMMECWGDDVPDGEVTSFPMAVKKKEDETVVFSWVTWPDKATRDSGWQKMMEDERMTSENMPMPFDGKRMIYGGFTTLVKASA